MSDSGDKKRGGFFGFFKSGTSSELKEESSISQPASGSEPDSLNVINPEGGENDAAEEAQRGRFKKEEGESYFKMMQKYIGADVTSLVTLPVSIFEPATMLQKMAELMEYTELLNKANISDDSLLQLAYAVGWAVSVYFTYQRTFKPFNPILGETFEMTNHNNVWFVAEQVSHHPPMSAGHGENEHFVYDCTSKLKTKFLGNSLEVYPLGRTRVTLKRTGHVFDLVPPPTKVHNLIFGRTWIDNPGDLILTNLNTKEKVVLYFQPCGWFGAGRYEVDGYIYDSNEEPKLLITGKWNEGLKYQPCDLEGEPLPGTQLTEIYRINEAPKNDKFSFTHFAHKLNALSSAPSPLLPSDSRVRPDRLALERGDLGKSGAQKTRLEERQRAEKRERESKEENFTPCWFRQTGEIAETPWGEMEMYEFTGEYASQQRSVQKPRSEAEMSSEEMDKLKFNPWQYDYLEDEEWNGVEASEGIVVR